MPINKYLSILATAATVAALNAPVAGASAIGEGGSGLPPIAHHVVATPTRSGSTDWELVAISASGAVVLLGTGLVSGRGLRRRRVRLASEPAR
jgi:hypothetical protein